MYSIFYIFNKNKPLGLQLDESMSFPKMTKVRNLVTVLKEVDYYTKQRFF